MVRSGLGAEEASFSSPAPAPRVRFYLGSKRYRDSELTHGFLRCGLNGVPLKSMPTQNLRMCPLFGNRLFELR